jgi:hypothetical protein
MFRSYDHHQVEKYIATLGLLNWQRIRCFIRSHIIVIVYILLEVNCWHYREPERRALAVCKHVVTSGLKDHSSAAGDFPNCLTRPSHSMRLVRKRIIPTELSPLVGEVSVNILRLKLEQNHSQNYITNNGQSACHCVKLHLGSNTRFFIFSENWGFVDVEHPLWR